MIDTRSSRVPVGATGKQSPIVKARDRSIVDPAGPGRRGPAPKPAAHSNARAREEAWQKGGVASRDVSRENVDRDSLRSGSRVLVLCEEGDEWKATIKKPHAKKTGQRGYKIHYDGTKRSVEYWVPEDRVVASLDEAGQRRLPRPPKKRRLSPDQQSAAAAETFAPSGWPGVSSVVSTESSEEDWTSSDESTRATLPHKSNKKYAQWPCSESDDDDAPLITMGTKAASARSNCSRHRTKSALSLSGEAKAGSLSLSGRVKNRVSSTKRGAKASPVHSTQCVSDASDVIEQKACRSETVDDSKCNTTKIFIRFFCDDFDLFDGELLRSTSCEEVLRDP